MAKKHSEILAGSITLLLILWGFHYAHQQSSLNTEERYRLTAAFGHIDGLPQGAEVRLSGVIIGRVEKAGLSPDFYPVLTLEIDDGVILPMDSSASIQTDGLFGNKYIAIEPGGAIDNIPPDGTLSYTENAMIVSELLSQIIARGHEYRQQQVTEITNLQAALKKARQESDPAVNKPQP